MAQAPGSGTGIGVHVIPGSEKSPGKKMLWKKGRELPLPASFGAEEGASFEYSNHPGIGPKNSIPIIKPV
ncbi:MAG: hypothetical protein AB3K77_16895, partial [Methanosarcinaceae archaeon]